MKVYCPPHRVFNVAYDWGFDNTSIQTTLPLQESYKIACVPVLYNVPGSYTYQEDMNNLDLTQFDLVLFSDIEYVRYDEIFDWIGTTGAGNYAVIVGGLFEDIPLDTKHMVYRPWWCKSAIDHNSNNPLNSEVPEHKPFLFDVLLGARRPHRDYVMLAMQKHPQLLDQCIVTYRDVFTNGHVSTESANARERDSQLIAELFPDQKLSWPYVSPNLDHAWEVTTNIANNISRYVPTEIYNRTWYSVICETGYQGTSFFMSEKFSKTVLNKRVFVMFGTPLYLRRLHELGFQTFDSVIDESYDDEPVDAERYKKAFNQVLSLSQQDPVAVYKKLQPMLEHNYYRMQQLWDETVLNRRELLTSKIS